MNWSSLRKGWGTRGWRRPAAFQAEGTACPEAQKRESPHGAVFGFAGAENVREERPEIRQAQSPGAGSRGSLCRTNEAARLSSGREGEGAANEGNV